MIFLGAGAPEVEVQHNSCSPARTFYLWS